MNSFNFKAFTIKILVFLVGIFTVQIGVGLFIQSNTGLDSYTIIMEGLSILLDITVGQANILVMTVLFVIILCLAREYIRIGTFLATFMTGLFLDTVNQSLTVFGISNMAYIPRLLILILGCVVISIGFSILNAPELSVSPLDQMPLIIMDRTKFTYSQIRMVQDTVFISTGYLLGGTLGFGTIISLFLIGPCIQFTIKYIGDPIKKKLNTL